LSGQTEKQELEQAHLSGQQKQEWTAQQMDCWQLWEQQMARKAKFEKCKRSAQKSHVQCGSCVPTVPLRILITLFFGISKVFFQS
jgi:hypothetical protein